MFRLVGEFWCKAVHARPMWPINGYYICSRCLRKYPIDWAASRNAEALGRRPVSKSRRHLSLTAVE